MSAPNLTPDPAVELSVRTHRIDGPVDLLSRLPADPSAAWLRDGQGLIGTGTAWAVQTAGPHRFAAAGAAFRAVAGRARVEDAARVPGSGLVCAGSFSYADSSARSSTLLVPRALLGVADGQAFLTVVGTPDDPAPAAELEELFPVTAAAAAVGVDGEGSELTVRPEHTPDEYQALVAQAVREIRAGAAEKVVLSEQTRVRSAASIRPGELVRRLADAYPQTWVYRAGDVVGASPEMLAQTSADRVFSRVLAGTRSVADDGELAAEDRLAFHRDEKELAEHGFAVDSVVERLAGVADGITASCEPYVLRLPGLEHLASEVEATLRDGTTSLDVAARLHPSAAVSGTPRDAADELIAQLEPQDRGGYAAPVGWMSADGDGQWAIALRMAHLVDEHTAVLQAGGGLVAASDPVSEHAEALAKCRPMLRALRGTGA